MPLVKLHTSVDVPEEVRAEILKRLSSIAAKTIGKPESYVMTVFEQEPICMGGEVAPAAFVDVRSIGGLNRNVNQRIAQQVCELLDHQLKIPGSRIYFNFIDVPATHWGWDSSTFG
ncbi:MAG: hypothetical protein JXR83_23750 [Deltaproteobacteria bacterium]|nr:hypothetical protein [Deltaproteobacteria bacterium]